MKRFAKHLRSREKPTFLVANKTDGLDPDQAVVDFYSLGLGEIYPIAASQWSRRIEPAGTCASAVDG
ncbi:GTP-binding protein EngA [Salmonella enterica subsp. enterica serovar Daytona]|uniref:GTP-binding protein EngA n=1 Tax=Salmonella enterica subsp. enterica serovar Daytona TaxID=1962639 RepID=A0A447JEE8_SALET|nr:GTP-binding protein EngA [Salmonella enterica subsp. enterica serovar Daytona]